MPPDGVHRTRRRWRRAASILTAVAIGLGLPPALAGFIDSDVAASGSFTSAADWIAPTAGETVIGKSTGYLTGKIRQGGTYFVYSNVTDSGNPASGVATVTADASQTTTGASNAALSSGSYSRQGQSYNYRSGSLTANGTLSEGAKSFSVTSTDVAGNPRVQTGFTVTVDNTAPSASDIQTANGSTTSGKAQAGDTITFTFSEQIDPDSILSGWTGASTSVVVRLMDGGCTLVLCGDDSFAIYNAANSSQLPLGTVDLNAHNYTGGGLLGTRPDSLFGATGTPSTMVQSGSTITITLGTASGEPADTGSNTTMAWDSQTSPYDAAGNTATGNTRNETGGSDKEF